MSDTAILSFLAVELTLLLTVASHQAVNPLKDSAQPHHVHHHQPPQQKNHAPAQHAAGAQHHTAHVMDRNSVHNQQ